MCLTPKQFAYSKTFLPMVVKWGSGLLLGLKGLCSIHNALMGKTGLVVMHEF